jgi:hypothetical protein
MVLIWRGLALLLDGKEYLAGKVNWNHRELELETGQSCYFLSPPYTIILRLLILVIYNNRANGRWLFPQSAYFTFSFACSISKIHF